MAPALLRLLCASFSSGRLWISCGRRRRRVSGDLLVLERIPQVAFQALDSLRSQKIILPCKRMLRLSNFRSASVNWKTRLPVASSFTTTPSICLTRASSRCQTHTSRAFSASSLDLCSWPAPPRKGAGTGRAERASPLKERVNQQGSEIVDSRKPVNGPIGGSLLG